MKRITSLICTALILIIGGVYAAWTYATEGIDPQNGKLSTALAGVSDVKPDAGTVTIVSTPKLTIDDLKAGDDATKYDHIAELYYEGDFVVTFVPTIGANDNYFDTGLAFELTINTPADKYNNVLIYKSKYEKVYAPTLTLGQTEVTDNVVDDAVVGTVVKDGSTNTFTWTIPAEEFYNLIVFNGGNALSLPTIADWTDFNKLHGTTGIGLVVREKATSPSA